MCIFEIISLVMLIGGIVALIKGEVALSKTKKVKGGRARIIGGIMVMPLPVLFILSFIWGVMAAASGKDPEEGIGAVIGISAVIFLALAGLSLVLLLVWSQDNGEDEDVDEDYDQTES